MSAPSYGDVTAEYRAARTESGFITDTHEIVWFSGADHVRFLNDLITQNVSEMEPGEVRRSLLLGPRGKLVALLWVLAGDDRIGLLTESGKASVVADTLSRYRIRVDVNIELDPRTFGSVVGPETAVEEGWGDTGELQAAIPLSGNRRLVTSAPPEVTLVGELAWTAVRVEAGEPVMDVDVDESTIPQESGLVPETVDFSKGCYLGQELVARIDSRGRVNKRLMGVKLQANVLPPNGADLVDGDGAVVGALTSPAESLTLKAPVGLTLLRREVEAGAEVTVRWDGGSAPAVVVDLPMVS